MTPIALTIAGSDPSGGAGIQADLKTFHQFGVYGEAVITLITVQNTRTVSRVELLDPQLVTQQIEAVLSDIPPAAIKTGALGSAAIVSAVAQTLRKHQIPLVLDPVMISKHQMPLIADDARATLVAELLPQAAIVTPNTHEAAALAGFEIATLADARSACERIAGMGPRAVLLKGGHLDSGSDAVDLLFVGGEFHEFRAARIETRHTHGTGCTYAAAITAEMAKRTQLVDAVRRAKAFITLAIRTNPGLGGGFGPVNHLARVE